jgi:hypothetical protein
MFNVDDKRTRIFEYIWVKASKQNEFKAIVVKPRLVDPGIIRIVSNSHSIADGF